MLENLVNLPLFLNVQHLKRSTDPKIVGNQQSLEEERKRKKRVSWYNVLIQRNANYSYGLTSQAAPPSILHVRRTFTSKTLVGSSTLWATPLVWVIFLHLTL